MRKSAGFTNTSRIASTLFLTSMLLTACSSPGTDQGIVGQGEVVSCGNLQFIEREKPVLELPCAFDQSAIDVGSLKGPALVNVWGSWCEPCVAETPLLRDFYAMYSSQVALLGVDIEEETSTSGEKFIVDYGITWPQVTDKVSKIRKLSGLGVPTTLFIAPDGTIAKTFVGPFSSLDQIVAESTEVFGIKLIAQ